MALFRKHGTAVVAILIFGISPLVLRAQQAPPAVDSQSNVQGQNRARLKQSLARHPGEEILSKLASMTQAEREQALSRLPPAQRARIEQRIQNFQKLPPAQQERTLERLERLNSLPPLRQAQVRRSLQQLNKLPQDRKAAINRELRKIMMMPEEERTPYINGEELGNRFSLEERQIMTDMLDILPVNP